MRFGVDQVKWYAGCYELVNAGNGHAGNNHRQTILFAIVNGICITYGSARLYKCYDACAMSYFYTIIKGKRMRRLQVQNPSGQKIKLPGLFYGMAQSISGLFARTFSNQLHVLTRAIALLFKMLANKICKTHICIFGFLPVSRPPASVQVSWFPTSDFCINTPFRIDLYCSVLPGCSLQLQQNPVLLCFQNFQRFNTGIQALSILPKIFR